MLFDLNEKFGDDLLMQNANGEVDEVYLYRYFEDVHRANEVVNDNVGIRENIFDWDLNVDAAVEVETEDFQAVEEEEVREVETVDVVDAAGEEETVDVDAAVEEETVDVVDEEYHEISAPQVGDRFDSIDEAFKYYQLFSKQVGFGIIKRSNHKKGNQINHCCFACCKQKDCKVYVDGPFPERDRPVVGTGCKACLKLKDLDLSGKWVVVEVILDHNHVLQPESSFLISGFRYIPKRYQDLLDFNEEQGLAVSVNINLVIKCAGGYMRCPFTRKDARNHIDKYKRSKLDSLGGDDCILIFEYFKKRQIIDRNFFYAYDYTKEGRLWSVFWSDGRSRAAYKYFHDVVVLDATYLTNR